MNKKWVYLFSEGDASMRDLLGGKGAGLAEMTKLGIRVPPYFTITTEACREYMVLGNQFPEGLWEQVLEGIKVLERETDKGFGNPDNPLLVSVRSGAKFSMPGMMDTVLNLGLNPDTLQGIIKGTSNERFGYDAYRRFIQMFGRTVLGMSLSKFNRADPSAENDTSATRILRASVGRNLLTIRTETGREFPTDPYDQLKLAIEAVFGSWMNKRAVDYRNFHKIPHNLGTAVNVQTMVFGNMRDDSGTGVVFTRNPVTGTKELYGEYLPNAQGEDIVGGARVPYPVTYLADEMPMVYADLLDTTAALERHFKDMQDIEFTVESGTLYVLQTRSGKRSAAAAIRMALDMVVEGIIDSTEAFRCIEEAKLGETTRQIVDPKADTQVLARGMGASPGIATGKVVFTAKAAEKEAKKGPVILVRPETCPDDLHGMLAAQGVLTLLGGVTSHAAVVMRGLGKPCVVGAYDISLLSGKKSMMAGGHLIGPGSVISINGDTGEVYEGEVPMVDIPSSGSEFLQV